ncbi:hypothetical protein [Butyrivibrio fibrisolvens]|uniref:hypothetical protein n=1 Tax=Butyrivibrio fibrisolvens TaxID=831 RepID=UPI00040A237D|nr:hypothetical protein [Butyrivibrio fibrisolvens]
MQININIKQLSKRGRRVKPVPFEYNEPFETVEDFIKETVKIMYKAFMAKESGIIESEDGVFNNGIADDRFLKSDQEAQSKVLSDEEINNMAEAGKIAFGLIYGDKNVTLDKAVETALLDYKDGLVRLFIGDEEAGDLKSKISLKDGDSVTFIRLTFLAGRIW